MPLKLLVITCYLGLPRLLCSVFAALPVPVCFEESTKTPVLGRLNFEDLSSQISHPRSNHENRIPFFEFLPAQPLEEGLCIPQGESENAKHSRREDRETVMVEEPLEMETNGYQRPSITQQLPQAHHFRDFQPLDLTINEEPHSICVPTETHSDGTEAAMTQKRPAENWDCLEEQLSENESSNTALKTFVDDHFELDLATKELSKITYPVLIRHNGLQMNYGPFHEFNRLTMFKLPHQTQVSYGYRENLREFLDGYACGHCRGWLSRTSRREKIQECKVISKLYIQSGISNAKQIGLFKEISEHFLRKKQRHDNGSKRSGGIEYKINLSKGITFMFLHHIRFVYEIIEVHSRPDELEGIISMHQKKGVEFSFRFWNSFDYDKPSLLGNYHKPEGSKKQVQTQTSQTQRDYSKEPKTSRLGRETTMIQWSWHMVKEYLISVKEPMTELLFSCKKRARSLEAFAKHCAMAELMRD